MRQTDAAEDGGEVLSGPRGAASETAPRSETADAGLAWRGLAWPGVAWPGVACRPEAVSVEMWEMERGQSGLRSL